MRDDFPSLFMLPVRELPLLLRASPSRPCALFDALQGGDGTKDRDDDMKNRGAVSSCW